MTPAHSDTWQIHAAGGLTALSPHIGISLTTLIGCMHGTLLTCSEEWEDQDRDEQEKQQKRRMGSQAFTAGGRWLESITTSEAVLSQQIYPQTRKVIITSSTSWINCVSHRNTREVQNIVNLEIAWAKALLFAVFIRHQIILGWGETFQTNKCRHLKPLWLQKPLIQYEMKWNTSLKQFWVFTFMSEVNL